MPLPALVEAKARGVSKALRASYLEEAKPEHPAYKGLDDLHYNANTKSHVPIHNDELKKKHRSARDATYFADTLGKKWPEKVQRYLHKQASKRHTTAGEHAALHGYSELAKEHHSWSEYHGGRAEPQKHAEHPPETPTHSHPEPAEPEHHEEPKPAAAEPKKPKKGLHWNDTSQNHERLPSELHASRKASLTASRTANDATKSGDHESAAQLHHIAAQEHMKTAQHMGAHGFNPLAHKHVRHAMKHIVMHNQHRISHRESQT